MVEGGAKEVSEELLLSAIEKAEGFIKELCRIQRELMKAVGKNNPMPNFTEKKLGNEAEVLAFAQPRMEKACFVIGKS